MTLLPLAAHILFFILNCGGKLDLTHGDLGVIDIERSKYSFAKPKVVKIVYYHIYKLFLYSINMTNAQRDYYY